MPATVETSPAREPDRNCIPSTRQESNADARSTMARPNDSAPEYTGLDRVARPGLESRMTRDAAATVAITTKGRIISNKPEK